MGDIQRNTQCNTQCIQCKCYRDGEYGPQTKCKAKCPCTLCYGTGKLGQSKEQDKKGGYYEKYIKYKAKYLKLKNSL